MGENGENYNNGNNAGNNSNGYNNNGNDYYYNNYNYNRTHNQMDLHVSMANTAMVLGLAAIPLCFFLNVGIIIGGVAVVLALLSKGVYKKLLPQARRGVIFGLIGIVLGYGIFIYDMHTIMTDPELRNQLNTMSEQMNGISFDDMLKQLGVTVDP